MEEKRVQSVLILAVYYCCSLKLQLTQMYGLKTLFFSHPISSWQVSFWSFSSEKKLHFVLLLTSQGTSRSETNKKRSVKVLIINLSLCVYALHRMLSSFSWTIIIRINLLSRHVHQWPVSKTPPDKSQKALTLGLLLNSDHSDVVLDTGPPADSAEVSDRHCFPFLSQTSQKLNTLNLKNH